MVKPTAGYAAGREPLRAPRGTAISCKGWQQEAALRMLMNSLDPEIAEAPEDTIIRSGAGGAAHDGKPLHAIVESLAGLENDETLLVGSGEPEGVFCTHADAPRVLIMGSSAGSWTFAGIQAYLQWAYEAMDGAARKYFQGSLAGKLVASAGMGARGGAHALGATLQGAAFLGIDADSDRIKRRVKSGYCDVMVTDLDEALRILKNAVRKREAASVGLAGDCADVFPEMASRGVVPDVMTDETCAANPPTSCIVPELIVEAETELPGGHRARSLESRARQAEGMLALEKMGAVRLGFGSGLSTLASGESGEGRAAVLWAALSGEPADMRRADDLLLEMFADNELLCRWIRLSRKRVRFQGLPARVSWLDRGERGRFALALNELVAGGELKAPLAITRLHLDGGASTPSLPRQREFRDGLDAIADGSKEMAARIERMLASDAGMGIVEYSGVSDPEAEGFAHESGMNFSAS